MSAEQNKAVVRRFIEDVLDNGQTDLILELFAPDCLIHFAHLPEPHRGNAAYAAALARVTAGRSKMVTTIEHMIAEDDFVAVQLRHVVSYTADLPSRVGILPAAGKTITWVAHPHFRLKNGRIAEEWIQRDEAGILQQLGGLAGAGRAS